MGIREDVEAAHARIEGFVRHTPVERSPFLSAETGALVSLKLENEQRTGSFKLRGAANKLFALGNEARSGVVAASTGNHGQAVACAASSMSAPAFVFAPRDASPSKLAAIRARGAEVVIEGDDCVVTETAARAFAEERGLPYVSPYNDPLVIAGQGTLGLELDGDLENIDALFLSVGGGGLASGVAGYLKAIGRDVEVVACSPRNSAVMHASLAAGEILDLPSEPTLSDGTAGGIEPGSITFERCRELIDDFVLLDEEAIASALRAVVTHHHTLIEGAAATAVAGLLKAGDRFAGRDVTVLLCGANIDPATLKDLL